MLDWFRKNKTRAVTAEPRLVHPPWHTGQYATYFLERADGSWVSIALRILGRANDGAWILSGDCKTRSGESRIMFRSDPAATVSSMDPTPGRIEMVRGTPIQSIMNPDHPQNQLVLVLNLLQVRRGPAAQAALDGSPVEVRYPCGVNQVYRLKGGYDYELNPRIAVTGVARASARGGTHPTTMTSFGCGDPAGCIPGSYDDFVDLSHLTPVSHDGFSLTYPATWFLRPTPAKKGGPGRTSHFAQAGGNTCAAAVSVTLFGGDPSAISEERNALLSRLRNPPAAVGSTIHPTSTDVPTLSGDAKAFAFNTEDQFTRGVSTTGLICNSTSTRLGLVAVSSSVSRGNPLLDATLTSMGSVFRQMVESFRLE